MYGIIDLGSNTVRLSIYKIRANRLELFMSKKETTGLASFVNEHNELTLEGVEAAVSVLKQLLDFAKQTKVKETFIVATASLRNVVNGREALQQIELATERTIDLLSGEEEAMYDYYGVQLNHPISDGMIVDIGGASTEVVLVTNHQVQSAFALPYGSLNTYVNFVKGIIPSSSESDKIKKAIKKALKEKHLIVPENLVIRGVGGSIRAARKLTNHIEALPITNRVIHYDQLKNLLESLSEQDKASYLNLIRIVPERIHTIIPGMIILKTIMKFFDIESVEVEYYGVREGYLARRLDIIDAVQPQLSLPTPPPPADESVSEDPLDGAMSSEELQSSLESTSPKVEPTTTSVVVEEIADAVIAESDTVTEMSEAPHDAPESKPE